MAKSGLFGAILLSTLLAVATLATLALPSTAAQPTGRIDGPLAVPAAPPVNIQVSHTDPTPAGEPTVAVNRYGAIMVDWEGQGQVQDPVGPVGMAFSTDQGRTFGPQTIVNLSGASFEYDVGTAAASPNGTFWLGYGACPIPGQTCSLSGSISSQDYVSIAWNNGSKISNPVASIPYSQTNTSFVDRDWIASTPNGTVYQVVDDATGATNDVFLAASYDGLHFHKPIVIYTNNGIPIDAFAWNDSLWGVADESASNTCAIILSADGGKTWNPTPATPSGCDATGGSISWQASWGAAHTLEILYVDGAGVEYTSSSDLGATWSAPVLVSGTVPSGTSWNVPTIATDPATSHVSAIWLDTRSNPTSSNWFVYESDSSDNGATWSTPRQMSTNMVGSGSSFWSGDFIGSTITPWGTAAGVWGGDDGNGTLQTYFAQMPLSPAPLAITSFNASPATITVGSSTTLTVTTSGGSLPLMYSYSGLPFGCTSRNASQLGCIPTQIGTFNITVSINGTSGSMVQSTTSLYVKSANSGMPTITSFMATPDPVTVGSPTNISVGVTGGTPPYAYQYSSLPAGCATVNRSSFLCVATTPGNYSLGVAVTDSARHIVTGKTSLTVSPSAGTPLHISAFTASPSTVVVGNSTTLLVTVTGGKAPYTYTYLGLPAGCSSSDVATLSCTPSSSGQYNITVNVTDSGSNSTTAVAPLKVSSPAGYPQIVSFAASPASISLGGSTKFVVVFNGGTAPYSVAYTNLPAGCATSNTVSLNCTPTVTGGFTINVTVTDANQHAAIGSTQLSVVPSTTAPTITSFTLTPNNFTLGGTTTLETMVTGGTLPYTFSYTGLPKGCSSANSSTISCTPSVAGGFNVTVTVTDSAHKSASLSKTLIVDPISTSSPQSNASPFSNVWLLLAIVGVLVAAIAIALFLRRRRPPEGSGSTFPAYGETAAGPPFSEHGWADPAPPMAPVGAPPPYPAEPSPQASAGTGPQAPARASPPTPAAEKAGAPAPRAPRRAPGSLPEWAE